MKKFLVLFLAFAFCIAVGLGYYLFNKKSASIDQLETELTVKAGELVHQFEDDEETANAVFLEKVIEVNGRMINSVIENGVRTIYLDGGGTLGSVLCQMEDFQEDALVGQSLTIKGICSGYLMDVVLIKCKIIHS